MSEGRGSGLIARLSPAISVLGTDANTAKLLSSFSAVGVESILLKGPAHQLWLHGRRGRG